MKSICYTGKQPLLIFTGTSSGELTKWESQPHSKYIYLSDNYSEGSQAIFSHRVQTRTSGHPPNPFSAYKRDLL